jgi:hypothetical protein
MDGKLGERRKGELLALLRAARVFLRLQDHTHSWETAFPGMCISPGRSTQIGCFLSELDLKDSIQALV